MIGTLLASGSNVVPTVLTHSADNGNGDPLYIFGFSGLYPVAGRGLEENPRVAQRDGPVALVGHDQAYRHYAVAKVVDAEDRLFFLGVIRLGGNGHLLLVVNLDSGKGGGRLHGRGDVVRSHRRQRQPEKKQECCPRVPHRGRLYHSSVDSSPVN